MVVAETNALLEMLYIHWDWLLVDGLELVKIRPYRASSNEVPKIVNGVSVATQRGGNYNFN